MPQSLDLGNPYPPELLNDYPLLTLSDCVFRLNERDGGYDGDSTSERMYTRAVRDALRDLPSKSYWNYYRRNFEFITSAPVTRNVTDVTAPASEHDGGLMRIQITDAETWPEDVTYGEVYLNDLPYPVVRHDSATKTITINKPTESYTGELLWYRKAYSIPRIRKIHGLWDMVNRRPILPRPVEEVSDRSLTYDAPGVPIIYTIRQESSFSQTEIILNPMPNEARSFLVVGSFEPRHPKLLNKLIVGSDATSVTSRVFTHPDANANWVGAVMRMNTSSGDPSEDIRQGEYDWQGIIWAVDGTSVTVASDIPADFYTNDIYISSIIDIDIPVMQSYFEALAYEYYCRNNQHEDFSRANAIAGKLYLEARGADSKWDASTKFHPFWSLGFDSETSFPVVTK